jgi:hypothetical protein
VWINHDLNGGHQSARLDGRTTGHSQLVVYPSGYSILIGEWLPYSVFPMPEKMANLGVRRRLAHTHLCYAYFQFDLDTPHLARRLYSTSIWLVAMVARTAVFL